MAHKHIHYIFNLAQPEAVRIDLKGNAVEPVSDDHRIHAAERLLAAKEKITKMKKRAKLV
jgi:sRNA-binding protein